ncbi:MAG: hypothetical protein MK102_05350 [Fuerstiella sp.]|nr:hypothetical protein [Fuerstiella sp.]
MTESEEQLISLARDAVSQCNWVVGECASKWTQKYARGRTDHDFGQMVGLSADQIYQRRRVWTKFGDAYHNFPNLKWSYFYVTLNWDDADECLSWANDTSATVAEMRAWRRARNGEDLNVESEEAYSEWAAPLIVDSTTTPLTAVVDPTEFVSSGQGDRAGTDRVGSDTETMAGALREGGDYSPFRSGAASPAPGEQEGEVAVLERPAPHPDQVWRRTVGLLERLDKSLTTEVIRAFDDQPEKLQDRVASAYDKLKVSLRKVLPE